MTADRVSNSLSIQTFTPECSRSFSRNMIGERGAESGQGITVKVTPCSIFHDSGCTLGCFFFIFREVHPANCCLTYTTQEQKRLNEKKYIAYIRNYLNFES